MKHTSRNLLSRYLLGAAVLAFAACTQQPKSSIGKPETAFDSTTDSIAYAIKTVVKESRNCNSEGKTDTTCQIVKITYPDFSESEKVLNDSLTVWLSGGMNTQKTYSSTQATADGFLQDYEAYLKEQKELPAAMPWELLITTSVVKQQAGIIPIVVDYYSYTGGAHGNPATIYHNWDAKSHKEIALDDILNSNYADSLRNIAEGLFRKQEKLSPTASLKQGYFFENAKFSLNDNFLITSQGLQFLYNPYEIKSYAEGKTKLLLPYDAIKTLIKKDGALARYGGNNF